ncbi:MAG TPA: sigma-54 dependent transcriptional regulator [Bacteroidota bacterium]|nr:sigma-54 dependent transcriptional regulator [Bacteroidota bacterium]
MDREEFQHTYGLVGQSPELQEVVDVIQQVAPTDIAVLIIGESGTGKEIVAKAIHGASKRAGKAMVSVNCGAIPEGLIESELFGHEKGSFTSAVDARQGYFEMANGGTIFLDEVGDMPLATQVKLLRVLESGEYMRVGSSMPKHTDVRVIAATNRSLEYEVQQKHFRADLFFRLRSVNIQLPPLRNRKEDIPALVEQFVSEVSAKNKISFAGFTDDATELLMSYRWPGNVRELKNAIESMLVLEGGRRLNGDDVQKYISMQQNVVTERNLPVVANKTVEQAERELIYRALLDLKSNIIELKDLMTTKLGPSNGDSILHESNPNGVLTIDEMERRMIQTALDRNKGNRRRAARELRISERSLYRKIKDYGIQ